MSANSILDAMKLRPVFALFLSFVAATPLLALARQETPAAAPVAAVAAQDASYRALVQPGPVPTELFEVATIVDGDTIHVMRNGVKEKLRLLCVDSEEKLAGNASLSTSKPETLFGQETAAWAQTFFPEHCTVDGAVKVGLVFPDGVERRDVYGRLLCHVVLPDGVDYQVLLVRLGKSPYFNKYGNSTSHHAAFVEAQRAAQRERLGIWNPATNRARTPGEIEVVRPYERLLPWWDARAQAIDEARARHARNPVLNVDAELPEQLRLAAFACEGGAIVQVFGAIERIFDEDDGSLTLLMRTGAKDTAVRVRIAKKHVALFDTADLRRRADGEYVQNYLVFTGRLAPGARGGFEMWLEEPADWRLGGPEPIVPEEVKAKG
jgi:endonuclease YncB( thermonuclease family)